MNRKDLGKLIRHYRQQKGKTQEALVDDIGHEFLSVQTLRRIERGDDRISLENLLIVMAEVGIPGYLWSPQARFLWDFGLAPDAGTDRSHDGNDELPVISIKEFILYAPLFPDGTLQDIVGRMRDAEYRNSDALLSSLAFAYAGIRSTMLRDFADRLSQKRRELKGKNDPISDRYWHLFSDFWK